MKIFSKRAFSLLPWRLVSFFGILTGCFMAGLGLAMRLTGSIPSSWLTVWFGTAFFEAAGISAGRIGWMLVLEGIFWIAALAALGVHNYWGWWSAILAGLISIIFFPGGTLAGAVVLLGVGVRLIHKKFGQREKKAAAPAQR
jgi:hypothetical protein